MGYSVKEIFYTLQGEGANAGRPAVFCRFAGCNLWSGHEADRAEAICQFCDTDFVGVDGAGGGKFESADELASTLRRHWPVVSQGPQRPLVVLTGGEPLLQVDAQLVDAIQAQGFEVALETNGTRLAEGVIDWICVSPKVGAELKLISGNELKFVFPQQGSGPEDFADLDFDHFYLQPMDGPDLVRNTELATQYCLEHPQWRLSFQTHKLIGIR